MYLYLFLLLLINSSLLAQKNDVILQEASNLKLDLSFYQDNEYIQFKGYIRDKNHIQQILSLIEQDEYSFKKNDTPALYRYPYDLSYPDVSASWNGVITTSGFWASTINDLDWFPNGNKLAVVGKPHTNNGIVGRIYSFSDNGTALYNDGVYTITWGGTNPLFTLTTVAVHPYQSYLVVGGIRTPGPSPITHRLIYLDETLTMTVIVSDFDHGTTVQSIAWSPDGHYLAVAGETSSNINLRIYRFEYGTLTELTRCRYFWDATNPLYSVAWHPSGNYLAVSGAQSQSSHFIKVLSFNQESITELVGARTINNMAGGYVPDISWNDEGTRLVTTHVASLADFPSAGGQGPQVYSFINNLSLVPYSSGSTAAPEIFSVSWSPGSAYISAGRSTQVDTYTSYDDAGSLSNITALNHSTSTIRKIRWNPDGTSLAVGTSEGVIQVRLLEETLNALYKSFSEELFGLYKNAFYISDMTTTLQELSVSNSAALISHITNETPSYSFLQAISPIHSGESPYCFDFSNNNQFILVGYDYSSAVPYEGTHLFKKNAVTNQYNFHASIPSNYSSYSVKCARFSPNNKLIATIGADPSGSPTYLHIYSFNGHTTTLKYSSSTTNLYNHFQWLPDSATFLHEGGIHSFNGSTLTNIDTTTRTSPSLDSTGKYFAHVTSPNTLVVSKYIGTTITTVTSTPVSSLSSLHYCTWENPSNIAVIKDSDPYGAAIYSFDGASLSLVGTTPLLGTISTSTQAKSCKFNTTGNFLLTAVSNNLSAEYKVNAPSGPIILTTNGPASYSGNYGKDDAYVILGEPRGFISIYTRQTPPPQLALTSAYTVLKGTSDAVNNISFTEQNDLNIQTSYAIISQSLLTQDNSNTLVTLKNLTIDNSNAIAGLLVDTSNAVNNFVIPNSQTLVTIKTKVTNNSNALVTIDALARANSNAIVTYQSLIVQNSTAISGLLVDTSNATAGLLVATSNAIAELLVNTSQTAHATALKLTSLATIDTAESHIHFNSASITMTYNLNLSTDHQLFVHTSGIVNGNGHSITFARGAGTHFTIDAGVTTTFQNVIFKDYNDQAVSLGSNASLIFGNQSRVELSEPQTLLRTWSFAGISQLNGLGNTLTLGSGPLFLSSLISSTLQLSNLNLLNVRENNIRAANNNSAINFQDVTLNMSADYTYSIGSITVQNDLTLHGTSTFNYTTIMGCTVNPASQLTVDQGMKLNYAPAGNFRNLLSLTDSSARLFFNNATLVATPTGPRLTKGTLIVDGIMNIQSAAASSAEAITFGDSTPANDLIINIFPGANLNLQTGFLNYANAQ